MKKILLILLFSLNCFGISIFQSNLSLISTVNSSIVPLVDAGIFTGTKEEVSQYSSITVFVDTDKDGTLSMESSIDGVNWDRKKQIMVDAIMASGSIHTLQVVARFFRIVYTNSTGNGDQTHFRLQTIYHSQKSGFPSSSPDQVISKSDDARLVRVSNDSFIDISRSLYNDKKSKHIFGVNESVPNGTFADIWPHGAVDTSYNWPATDENFRVQAGGNVADTAAGAGCRTIQIVYLDSLGNEQQDQLTLAGASVSTSTSSTARRFIRAFCDTAGTILSNNTGAILIENDTAGEVVGTISAGVGKSQMSMYTVPLGFTAYILRLNVSVAIGTNKDADINLLIRTNAYTTSAPFGTKRLLHEWNAIQGLQTPIVFKSLPRIAPLTDIWFEAKGNGASTTVDIDYDLMLVKDENPTVPQ